MPDPLSSASLHTITSKCTSSVEGPSASFRKKHVALNNQFAGIHQFETLTKAEYKLCSHYVRPHTGKLSYAAIKQKILAAHKHTHTHTHCSNQSPLALRAPAVNAATKQPRHEVRVSTWLSEPRNFQKSLYLSNLVIRK